MPFGTLPLNDGHKIPAIAFGTGSNLAGHDPTEYLEQAPSRKWFHSRYQNEEMVGTVIRESGLARSEIYITTKYFDGNVQDRIRSSLSKDFEGTWKEFEKIKEDGLAKSIGVSNFSVEQLQIILKTAKIKPAVNQIRFHAYNYAEHKSLLEFSAKHGIVTEAYGSLSPVTKMPGGSVDIPLAAAAKRIGVTLSQVILSWVQSKGIVIVTTTKSKQHLEEYLAVPGLPALTKGEILAIDEAGAKGHASFSLSSRS